MRNKNSGISIWLWIQANDRLTVEVFGHVRNESVLTNHNEDVFWGKLIPIKITAFELDSSKVVGQRGRYRVQRRFQCRVSSENVVDGSPARAQKELCLSVCCVPRYELGILRAPINENDPRR
jgi:hypothetical protein